MRKIVVYSTKTQTKNVVETEVTTLGELKELLDQKGIDYTGMTFYEGISNTELLDDNSILPSNLPYKGKVTNDLVIQLTLPNKKIESGLSRSDIYSQIKEYGLEEAVLRKYGNHYTRVSSENLITVIEENKISNNESSKVDEDVQSLIDTLVEVFESLHNQGINIRETYDISSLDEFLVVDFQNVFKVESPFSDDEIEDLLRK